jgi:hypothetical protein
MKLRDRGFVSIELDKTRHLKIDFRAARLIEKELGKPLTKLSGDSVGITEMNVIFYAALVHERIDDWSLEKAEELMLEAESFQDIMEKIGEAIELFFGEGKKNQSKN